MGGEVVIIGARVEDILYGGEGTVMRVLPEGSHPETLVKWDNGSMDWHYARTELKEVTGQ
jgi:hypothetical protein